MSCSFFNEFTVKSKLCSYAQIGTWDWHSKRASSTDVYEVGVCLPPSFRFQWFTYKLTEMIVEFGGTDKYMIARRLRELIDIAIANLRKKYEFPFASNMAVSGDGGF